MRISHVTLETHFTLILIFYWQFKIVNLFTSDRMSSENNVVVIVVKEKFQPVEVTSKGHVQTDPGKLLRI